MDWMRDGINARRWCLAVLAWGGVAFGVAKLGHPTTAAAFADRKAAGAELFATRGCVHCHGDAGQGTERGPALRDLRKKLSANRMQDQIVHGGQGMPAFGDALKPEEVSALVSFLRAKTWLVVPPVAPSERTNQEPGATTP